MDERKGHGFSLPLNPPENEPFLPMKAQILESSLETEFVFHPRKREGGDGKRENVKSFKADFTMEQRYSSEKREEECCALCLAREACDDCIATAERSVIIHIIGEPRGKKGSKQECVYMEN